MAEDDPQADGDEAETEAETEVETEAGAEAGTEAGDGAEDGTEEGNGSGKKAGKKDEKAAKQLKRLLIVGGTLVLLIVLGAAGWGTGLLPSLFGIPTERTEARINLGQPTSYDLPVIKADLKTGACSAPLLITQITIEVLPKNLSAVKAAQKRIIDQIVAYLRGIERQELVGTKGTNRLRVDIIRIINNQIQPASIQTILFKELLLQ